MFKVGAPPRPQRKTIMKRYISTILAGAALTAGAQIFEVQSVEPITLPAGLRQTQVAAISHDGSFVLLTDDTYNGLARLDLATGAAEVITTATGAGIDPSLSADDSHVAFRDVTYSETHRRLTAVQVADLSTRQLTRVVPHSREVQGVAISGDAAVAVVAGQTARRTITPPSSTSRPDGARAAAPRASAERPVLSIAGEQLMITRGGTTTLLSPCGTDGCSYIWPSLSPDGRRVMFYLVGRGIYSCDLNGGDLRFVADLHAPVWYSDDVIVAMNDVDGLDTQVSSEIIAVRLSDGERQTLCGGSDLIAMYPVANAATRRIAFTTRDGAPHLITLR